MSQGKGGNWKRARGDLKEKGRETDDRRPTRKNCSQARGEGWKRSQKTFLHVLRTKGIADVDKKSSRGQTYIKLKSLSSNLNLEKKNLHCDTAAGGGKKKGKNRCNRETLKKPFNERKSILRRKPSITGNKGEDSSSGEERLKQVEESFGDGGENAGKGPELIDAEGKNNRKGRKVRGRVTGGEKQRMRQAEGRFLSLWRETRSRRKEKNSQNSSFSSHENQERKGTLVRGNEG